jgi:hypothetical protein
MFRLVFINPKLVELVVLVDGYVQQVLTVRELKCMVLSLSAVLVIATHHTPPAPRLRLL